MSNTCLKTFTMTVAEAALDPYLWWPMEQTGSLDRVDTVQGLHMTNSINVHAVTSRDTGKVAFGMEFTNASSANGSSDWWVSESAVAKPWTGIEVDFWYRWDNWSDLDPYSLFVQSEIDVFYGGGFAANLFFQYNKHNLHVSISDDLGGFASFDLPFIPVAGTWYFFSVFYDTITGTYGIQINNAAPAVFAVGVAPGGVVDTLDTTIVAAFGDVGATAPFPALKTRIDEYAVFLKRNSAGSVALVYNSGNGRTWP